MREKKKKIMKIREIKVNFAKKIDKNWKKSNKEKIKINPMVTIMIKTKIHKLNINTLPTSLAINKILFNQNKTHKQSHIKVKNPSHKYQPQKEEPVS